MSPLLAGKGLGVTHRGETILDNVDIEVAPGEIVTLIGPNGSGKTTLVRVLLGLQDPDRGTVTRRRGLTIGYVPQRLALDPTFPVTARRFLSLAGRLSRAKSDALLREVGVPHIAARSVHSLSGGEFQRLLLARALAQEPDLLVLDEPAQGVDVAGQAALYHLIREERNKRGCGVLLVSHDLHVVMAQTDEVVCLNRHVCCHGKPEVVRRDKAFTDLFGREAAETFAVYTHQHDHVHDVDGHAEVVDGGEGAPERTGGGAG